MNVLTRILLAFKVIVHGETALMTFDSEQMRLKNIVAATAKVYGISPIDLLGRKRKKEFSEARQAAMLLASKCTKWGYSDIGRFFNRDHTTVMYAERKLEQDNNPGLKYRLELIKKKAKIV